LLRLWRHMRRRERPAMPRRRRYIRSRCSEPPATIGRTYLTFLLCYLGRNSKFKANCSAECQGGQQVLDED
jgi:hypothetical protein